MSERTFVLAIDAGCSPADIEKIQQYITTSSDFSSWWNHLPMVFLLESKQHTAATGQTLHTLTPDARFLLTEVNLADSQGWLPAVSWKWIEKRALAPTPQQSSRF